MTVEVLNAGTNLSPSAGKLRFSVSAPPGTPLRYTAYSAVPVKPDAVRSYFRGRHVSYVAL